MPADPKRDYSAKGSGTCGDGDDGWYDCLYLPGNADGRQALALAQAYAVTGDPQYGDKAKAFLLAWVRGYAPPSWTVGHAVAEPVGFAIKGWMAYDLVRDRFSAAERASVVEWTEKLVELGRFRVEDFRDRPWVPEAPYGNGATWSRALAVYGAAVVGRAALAQTLAWSFRHRTPKGKDGSWPNLVDGAFLNTAGKMTEERVRESIDYALFTWYPMVLIADVARRAGIGPDLYAYRTSSGKTLLSAVRWYEPYLTKRKPSPYAYDQDRDLTTWYRAAMEFAYRDVPGSVPLRTVVSYGGPATRGSNHDPYIAGYNALIGAGLKQARG